jgi:hypothetical protein
LGIGDWAQSPIPNPQSPIPNPQSPFTILNNKQYYFIKKIYLKIIFKCDYYSLGKK